MSNNNNASNTLAIWFAAALFFVASLSAGLYAGVRISRGNEAHAAICALEHDVQVRHDASVKFLANHPKGIPGIPVGVIKTSLANQAATIKALKKSGLEC